MVVLLLIVAGVDRWESKSQITKAKKVYRFRAIPDGGSRLRAESLSGKHSVRLNRGVTNHPRPVLAPGSALGLLLSIALSSGQARITVNKMVRLRNYN